MSDNSADFHSETWFLNIIGDVLGLIDHAYKELSHAQKEHLKAYLHSDVQTGFVYQAVRERLMENHWEEKSIAIENSGIRH